MPRLPSALISRASIQEERKQFDKVLTDAEAALRMAPRSADALLLRAGPSRS